MTIHERVDLIIASYEGGAPTKAIAAEHEIPTKDVCAVLRLAGVPMRHGAPRGPKPGTIERVRVALALRGQGKPWQECADEAGYNTVDQVWHACNNHPGLAP